MYTKTWNIIRINVTKCCINSDSWSKCYTDTSWRGKNVYPRNVAAVPIIAHLVTGYKAPRGLLVGWLLSPWVAGLSRVEMICCPWLLWFSKWHIHGPRWSIQATLFQCSMMLLWKANKKSCKTPPLLTCSMISTYYGFNSKMTFRCVGCVPCLKVDLVNLCRQTWTGKTKLRALDANAFDWKRQPFEAPCFV